MVLFLESHKPTLPHDTDIFVILKLVLVGLDRDHSEFQDRMSKAQEKHEKYLILIKIGPKHSRYQLTDIVFFYFLSSPLQYYKLNITVP